MKRSVLMLLVCCLCLVSLTYSWFTSKSKSGESAVYNKKLIIGGGVVRIENYYGVLVDTGTAHIDYSIINGGIEVNGVYPGSKQFFKTVIYNDSDNVLTLSALLPSVLFDPELVNYISVVATNPSYFLTKSSNCSDYTDISDNHKYKMITGVVLGERLNIKQKSYITITWHIAIDEEAPNSCMGKKVKINGVQTTS